MSEQLAMVDKVCCFLFYDDDDHSHTMGTIMTNDIVYYHALPITKENTANCREPFMMTIFISKCLKFCDYVYALSYF